MGLHAPSKWDYTPLQILCCIFTDKLKTDIAVYSNKNTAVEIVQVSLETLSNMMFENRAFQDRFMACSGYFNFWIRTNLYRNIPIY